MRLNPKKFLILVTLIICSIEQSNSYASEFPSCKNVKEPVSTNLTSDCCGIKVPPISNDSIEKLGKNIEKINKQKKKEELLDDLKQDILKTIRSQIDRENKAISCLSNEKISTYCRSLTEKLITETKHLYPLLRAHLALVNLDFQYTLVDHSKTDFDHRIKHISGKTKLEPIQKSEEPLILKLKQDDKKLIKNTSVHSSKSKIAKDHYNVVQEIISFSPHLINFSSSKLPDSSTELKKLIIDSKKQVVSQAKAELDKLSKKPSSEFTFVYKYPHLIEEFIKRNKPDKLLCDVVDEQYKKYKEGGTIDLMQDIGLIAGGLVGTGACIISAGTACAVVVAIGIEAAFITKDQLNLLTAKSLENAKLIQPSTVKELENKRNTTVALAPIALIGIGPAKAATKLALKVTNHKILKNKIAEYLYYAPTTAVENAKWISIAKAGNAHFFIDVENTALKRLNDTLGDKNVVTSLTNLHKKILFEKMNSFSSKYKDITMISYSDFKSSRFSFKFNSKKPENFESELKKIIDDVNKQYDLEISKLKELELGTNVPSKWFNAGMGESADQAGLISRMTRSHEGKVIHFKDAVKLIDTKRHNVETIRKQIEKSVDKSLLTKYSNGISLPNLKVFEVLRKNINKTDAELVNIFKNKFNVAIDIKQAQMLKEYLKEVDSFSPGLWVEKRDVANLDNAVYGGFSSDFKGMGANNIRQVAYDLSFTADPLEKSIARVRNGEGIVTKSFNQQKTAFENLMTAELKKMGVNVKIVCSGDDCVSIPTRALKANEEEALVRKIATTGRPDALRISFIRDGVKQADRTKLSVHGELIEKELREKIIGFSDGKLKPKELENITIAVRMPSKVGSGKVELIVAGGKTTPVTGEQLKIIHDHFKISIDQVNKSITKETNVKNNYSY